MKVTLHYFAWLRERTGITSEEVDLPDEVDTIGSLMTWLADRGEEFSAFAEHGEVIQAAVDQKHQQNRDALLDGAREIAFFPPMTGG